MKVYGLFYDEDYKHNDDEFNFELVTKGNRDVYFQVFYKNDLVYLSGYLIGEYGRGAMLWHNGTNSALKKIKGPDDDTFLKPSELKIPPLFKYPREKYYSEKN